MRYLHKKDVAYACTEKLCNKYLVLGVLFVIIIKNVIRHYLEMICLLMMQIIITIQISTMTIVS